MKRYLILILLFINFLTAFSQNDNNAIFQSAKSAYQTGNYETFIKIISNYKNSSPSPEFEKLFIEEKTEYQIKLIYSFIEIKDNINAQNQIELFFKYYQNKTSEYYIKVREYELIVEKENIKEDELFNTIQLKKSFYYSYEYLKNYPYGKYKKIVTDSISSYNEFDSWKYCLKEKEVRDCQHHLKTYPNGKHSKEISFLLDSLEVTYYNKAINSTYLYIINEYLLLFPNGKYYSTVEELYKSKLYFEALNGSDKDMEIFLQKFPNDSKSNIVDSLLQRHYLAEGNSNFRKWKFNTASDIYSEYLKKYEHGIYRKKVEKKLLRANLLGNLFDEDGVKDYDYTYFMYNYDLEPSHGITISQLNNKRISFYYNLRFNFITFDTVTIFSNGTNTSKYDLISPSTETRKDLLALSIGIKYNPINYPIWFYGSVGYERYDNVTKYLCYNITNGRKISQGSQYFNSGKTNYIFYPEVGVITSFLKIFLLKYGVMYNGNWVQQFGFGIKINNDYMPSLIPESCTNSCMNFLFIGWGN
jgi:hypothetical protein